MCGKDPVFDIVYNQENFIMSGNLYTIDIAEQTAVLKLKNGVTNPLSLEFVKALTEAVVSIKDNETVSSLVICSANEKFFSIGWNLPELINYDREQFSEFFRAFNRLSMEIYTFPKPVITAISGHAVAGGCLLALCSDYRFIAEGRKLMGLNEIKLGVPIPYPGDCMLRNLTGYRNARDIVDFGEFYEPDRLLELEMVDKVLPPEELINEALREAKTLGSFPAEAFMITKESRIEDIVTVIKSREKAKEESFLDCWFSEPARAGLKAAAKKF